MGLPNISHFVWSTAQAAIVDRKRAYPRDDLPEYPLAADRNYLQQHEIIAGV
jgi:hypothetical protein